MGFEDCHPAVNFLFFSTAICFTVLFNHPVFLLISLTASCVYSIRRNGRRAVCFNLCLLPCAAVFALWYGSFHHFGMTVLMQNAIGNNITLESMVYGGVLGLTAAAVMMWMSCVFSVISSDKVVYLFGRISPKLSLFLTILLRMIPRIKAEVRRIHTARCAIGRGVHQGNIFQRAKNGIKMFSMLISWSIGALATASESMGSRGGTLRGRTAFSLYRFDNRDRVFVIFLCAGIVISAMAWLSGQGSTAYNPIISFRADIKRYAYFPLGYGFFCNLPFFFEKYQDFFFRKRQKMRS